MNEEDELRRLLAQVVPDSPLQVGHNVAAVARVRQRRRKIATFVAVGAVILAVGIPVSARSLWSGDADASLLRPGEHLGACPLGYGPGVIRFDLQLEPGAVAAKVCGDPLAAGTPTDVLTTGVAELVEEINALPESTEPRGVDFVCSDLIAESRPRPAILFEYPDGSVRGIGLPFCGRVTFDIAGTGRGNAADVKNVLLRFADLVFAQMQPDQRPPGQSTVFTCADRPLAPHADVPKLTRGILCPTVHEPFRRNLTPIELGSADLSILESDVRSRVQNFDGPGDRCTHQTEPTFAVVGQDPRGLIHRLELCGAYPAEPIGPFDSDPGEAAPEGP